ncbi:MAG: 5-(carboxyamino)imidazole ribonucleotide mutase [Syntrophales bacterium]|nr:5-(carboxyamino)imidazole ribonucleotide mutase [Syntrophales bacterium]MDD5232823.1 5-(carboxyamino)imidazole ribonucleotide mutase [Syntrophales bacterium]
MAKTLRQKNVLVSVIIGSDSDLPVIEGGTDVLDRFGIAYEVVLSSAHRSPERTYSLAAKAAERGIQVIIACAGAAAHLAGVIASRTTLPVIGVPVNSPPLNGLDSLLSTVQMPGGVPVASMAIGKAGAKNAALMAVRILALGNSRLVKELQAYAVEMGKDIEEKQEKIDLVLKNKSQTKH